MLSVFSAAFSAGLVSATNSFDFSTALSAFSGGAGTLTAFSTWVDVFSLLSQADNKVLAPRIRLKATLAFKFMLIS